MGALRRGEGQAKKTRGLSRPATCGSRPSVLAFGSTRTELATNSR